MNQLCKVCGEPAAGFHFGAFTCEGCKSFFGRSYNNINSITECKNGGQCVINKKNRTSCKACRLRKCFGVGMSKSGSRYGRRSNWFKIHCLLQEQQQQQQQQQQHHQQANVVVGGGGLQSSVRQEQRTPPPHHHHNHQGGGGGLGLNLLAGAQHLPPPLLQLPTKEELMLLGFEEYKHATPPSVSSPESHNSDSSVEVSESRKFPPFFRQLFPPTLLHHPPNLLFSHGFPPLYPGILHPANNNNSLVRNHNPGVEAYTKRIFLDAVLKSQRAPTPEEEMDTLQLPVPSTSPVQVDPIDLSMKSASERGSSPARSDRSGSDVMERDDGAASEADEESDCDSDRTALERIKLLRPGPLDLTTKV